MVSYAQKYDVSENLNHNRLDRIRYKMCENMSTRKGHIWLDVRKFSCAKISTFTVVNETHNFGGRGEGCSQCKKKKKKIHNFNQKLERFSC